MYLFKLLYNYYMNTIYALNNPIVRRATTVLELFYIMLMNLCQFQEKLIYKKNEYPQ